MPHPLRYRVLRKCNSDIDTRLELLLRNMISVYPKSPYVLRGEWSWSSNIRIDLIYHYLPVAFILLSPLDTDMALCVKYFGKDEWIRRQERKETLISLSNKAKCPIIFADPEDDLSVEWIGRVLKGVISE